eukprot:432143_1
MSCLNLLIILINIMSSTVKSACCNCLLQGPIFGDASCQADGGECANILCNIGDARFTLTPDEFCCSTSWDTVCVTEATIICGDETINPSLSPTLYPSVQPTLQPTKYPSIEPTKTHTIYPTIAPSVSPTSPPTPHCPALLVKVIDAIGFPAKPFDGLYTFKHKDIYHGRPIWIVPQMATDKNIEFDGSNWIINGENNGVLSYASNALYPPESDINAEWTHSSVPGTFHVDIKCVVTSSPVSAPTNAPTISPTISPSIAVTYQLTKQPTANPTHIHTSMHTTDRTHYPTFIPIVNPTNNPTQAPLVPTMTHTANPISHPSIHPTFDPTVLPTNSALKSKHISNQDGLTASSNMSMGLTTLICGLMAIFIVLFGLFCVICLQRHKQKQLSKYENNVLNMRVTSVSMNSPTSVSIVSVDNDISPFSYTQSPKLPAAMSKFDIDRSNANIETSPNGEHNILDPVTDNEENDDDIGIIYDDATIYNEEIEKAQIEEISEWKENEVSSDTTKNTDKITKVDRQKKKVTFATFQTVESFSNLQMDDQVHCIIPSTQLAPSMVDILIKSIQVEDVTLFVNITSSVGDDKNLENVHDIKVKKDDDI